MIKVDQTIVCKDKGNCTQATLASLFELPLDDVINIAELPDLDWFTPFTKWIKSIGYDYYGVINAHSNTVETFKALRSVYAVDGYFYAVVPSKTFENVTHAVIMDREGNIVHDPNPNKKWQGINVVVSGDLIYWYVFEPKNGLVYPL